MEKKIRFLVNIAYWGAIIAITILLFRYAIPPVLPFVFGFTIASLWNPLITKISRIRKRWFASAVIILPFWGILLFLLWKTATLVYSEAVELLKWMQTTDFNEFFSSLEIPFLEQDVTQWFLNKADDFVPTLLELSQSGLKKLLDFLLRIPTAVFFCFAMVSSSFLFSVSYPKIEPFILRQLPLRLQTEYYDIKDFLVRKILRIFRAHGIMFAINYCELLVGFCVIGIPYPIILAAVIALCDLLPFIGVASILVPWGIVDWVLLGNVTGGICLIILAAVVCIAREILEPRIVGKNIGLSALATLFGIYVGLKLLGIFGVFLVPLAILFLKEWNESGRILLWKNKPN